MEVWPTEGEGSGASWVAIGLLSVFGESWPCTFRSLILNPEKSLVALVFPVFIQDRWWFKRAHSGTYQSAALPARAGKPGEPRCLPSTF